MHEFQQSQPLIINIMLYRRRDGDLYKEIMSVPNKFRAERLRNLANLCCLLREMGGIAVDSDRLHSLAEQYYANTAKQAVEETGSKDVESSIPLKLTVNFYNYPELYRDLAAIPSGNLSGRIKSLASAGSLLNDISRLARNAETSSSAQNPQEHTTFGSTMVIEKGADEEERGREAVVKNRDPVEKPVTPSDSNNLPKKNSAIRKIRM